MKINSNKLRNAQIIMDCVLIVFFGTGAIMSFVQGLHMEASLFLLLVLAWAVVLAKDLELGHYIKLVDLYKELERKQDKYINLLICVINEKQTDNDTDIDTRK